MRLLSDTSAMVGIAIVLAMVTGGIEGWNPDITKLSLIAMMSLSMGGLGLGDGHAVRGMSVDVLASYAIVPLATVPLALFFDGGIGAGWILVAAVPPAISNIAFSLILGGNAHRTLISTTACYIISVVATPLMVLALMGVWMGPAAIITVTVTFIALPFVLSRGVGRIGLDNGSRMVLINICLFLLVFSVVGGNRDLIVTDPWLLAMLLIAASIRIFGLGTIIWLIARRNGLDHDNTVSLILFSTFKNNGIAAALAVSLVSESAALPALVSLTLEFVWFMALERWLINDRGPIASSGPSPL